MISLVNQYRGHMKFVTTKQKNLKLEQILENIATVLM